MSIHYQSLVGYAEGARKLHIHLTEISDTASHPPYQHEHKAEEVFFILEGAAEYTFAGLTVKAGPGETVFIPSGVRHAEIRYLTPAMRYLTIRTVEDGDEPCCCGADRKPVDRRAPCHLSG
ncbi:MAG: cupin domain-containing protein [Verrucomicrobiae bacterium]|nr:cupin domain-containing protein [Verrucomicrobiae bacterium]